MRILFLPFDLTAIPQHGQFQYGIGSDFSDAHGWTMCVVVEYLLFFPTSVNLNEITIEVMNMPTLPPQLKMKTATCVGKLKDYGNILSMAEC